MIEIEKCKYLLPCGYCDKYDIPCKAKAKKEDIEDIINFYNVSNTEDKKCEHEWESFPHINFHNSIMYEIRRCNKCKMIKEFPIGAL